MNRLVPYLDLFCRLSDDELARLARVPMSAVESLRQQVDEVGRALGRWADLLPRLADDELARLTGATVKTIRFWRLSQPRHLQGDTRRRSNPDLTPTPQPIPHREPSTAHRSFEDAAESSAGIRARAADSGAHDYGREGSDSSEASDASESSTFVIDTVE
ncbi:hypothetical protein [Enhygromyxa salina]|nr:hypothetical protein [Enhygromyxa salina]